MPSKSSLASAPKPGTSTALLPRISELEASLRTIPVDLNPLSALLDVLSTALDPIQPKVAHAAVYALHRAFGTLVRQGRIHGRVEGEEEAVSQVRQWLQGRYNEFVDVLVGMMALEGDEGSGLRMDSLTVLMAIVRTESEARGALAGQKEYRFAEGTWRKIVRGLLVPSGSGKDGKPIAVDLRAEFLLRYFGFCDDIRYYFLKEAAAISEGYRSSSPPKYLSSNLLSLLDSLTTMPTVPSELNEFWADQPSLASVKRKPPPQKNKKRKLNEVDATNASTGIFDSSESEDDAAPTAGILARSLPALLSLSAHRKVFSKAWRALLDLPLTTDQVKKVLSVLHRLVIPHMGDPRILMDFLVDCTNKGGTEALLALDGLFTLMTKHNLDYPNFYTKLYSLLDRQLLHVRYRPRFFRMLNTFLSSTLLPVLLIASYIKRLARLSLSAAPAALVGLVPFVYNLLKKHEGCMVMLHRESWAIGIENDPFNPLESDPLKTGALDSSLWELAALKNHYLASVATLAKVFGESFDKQSYELDDFLDHTYGTLFDTEVKRQIRKPPALGMGLSGASASKVPDLFPTKLITGDDSESQEADIVSQMWAF